MKIDRPTFVNTIEYSPFGLSGNEDQRVVRDPDDLKLLNQLLSLATYESYKWSGKILLSERISFFSDRVEQLKGRSPVYFEAKPGPFWWRLLALVYVPLNFAIILCALLFLTELVVLVWAAAVSFFPAFSLQPWFYEYFVGPAAFAMKWAFRIAVVVGFGFALVMAYNPRLASARGYAYVAGDSTAIIVFCGSTFWCHPAINAVIWPWIWPRRHAGFLRAWRHIKKDVEDWLGKALPQDGEIILTGHSLGGAIAELAAYELPNSYRIKHVACWGSPRIGGGGMKRRYADKPNLDRNTWHIARKGDSVPRLPPPLLYQHVGREFTSSEDGVMREIADPPYLFGFLNVVYDVRVILNNGVFPPETERRKHTPDGVMARRVAEKLSFVSYVPWPWNNVVNIVVVITGVFCYYVRAIITGFFEHEKERYYGTVGSHAGTILPAPMPQKHQTGTDTGTP